MGGARVAGCWRSVRGKPFGPSPVENPLPSEGFKLLTDWPGSEAHAEISPDGKVVAFLADRDGELDLFAGQLATGDFKNLTENIEPYESRPNPALDRVFRRFGQTVVRRVPRQKVEMPWSGGTPRPFLVDGAHTPAWSSDDRLVYFNNADR